VNPARRRARVGSRRMPGTGAIERHPCFRARLATLSLAACAQTVFYEKAAPYTTLIVTKDRDGLRTLLFEGPASHRGPFPRTRLG
jgi:hypothetical protein